MADPKLLLLLLQLFLSKIINKVLVVVVIAEVVAVVFFSILFFFLFLPLFSLFFLLFLFLTEGGVGNTSCPRTALLLCFLLLLLWLLCIDMHAVHTLRVCVFPRAKLIILQQPT